MGSLSAIPERASQAKTWTEFIARRRISCFQRSLEWGILPKSSRRSMERGFCSLLMCMDTPLAKIRSSSDPNILFLIKSTLNAGYCLKYSPTRLRSSAIIPANFDYLLWRKKPAEATLTAKILCGRTPMRLPSTLSTISQSGGIKPSTKDCCKSLAGIWCWRFMTSSRSLSNW